MKKYILLIAVAFIILSACSTETNTLTDYQLNTVNRTITSTDKSTNTIAFDRMPGAGLGIIEEVDFETGTIALDIKGENNPGQSFVGLAFNVQNDSTYEAIYFRPFNFQSKEKIRREHSIQYISLPKFDWSILRTNQEGVFEAEYPRQPSPNEWFSVEIKVGENEVTVFEKGSEKVLLSVKRLTSFKSKKIALWMGHNSIGKFRNLMLKD
jgi:hypothetical protein